MVVKVLIHYHVSYHNLPNANTYSKGGMLVIVIRNKNGFTMEVA